MLNDTLNDSHASRTLVQARAGWIVERIGRIGVAFLFIDAARYHVSSYGWRATLTDMAARGVPAAAPLLVLAMVASTTMALALVFGIRERWAALGLAIYTICVSSVMYNPFAHLGYGALVLFLKDICICGALLALSQSLVRHPWPRGTRQTN